MNDMGQRVREVRTALGLTQTQLGYRVGYAYAQVCRIELGTRKIPDDKLTAFCTALGVDEHWLRTGEGTMFKPYDAHSLAAMVEASTLTLGDVHFIEAFLRSPQDVRNGLVQFFNRDDAKSVGHGNPDAPE